jgi:circadian clock protein KaiC
VPFPAKEPAQRQSTGVDGLDEILGGGLVPGRAYLVRGGPGTGKTTLGLHFLRAGATDGEPSLYITLAEPADQIRQNAQTLGLDLDGVDFLDLSPDSDFFTQGQSYDLFTPGEVERDPLTRQIRERVTRLRPKRVFLDAVTQLRYLSPDPFQFRKQVLSFLRFLAEHGATVLFLSEASADAPDDDVQFMSDGVVHLSYAPEGRTVEVTKFRGAEFRAGRHAMRLTAHGMEVFPRLLPGRHRREFTVEPLPSGVPHLDELLHGGLERGTITLITGPSGAGKTTLGVQFMKEAAGRGERSVVYTFEETAETLTHRCAAVNMPVQYMLERGTLAVIPVEPLRFAADEFAQLVRQEVEERGARIVMIDSVSGYRLALRGEGDLVVHLHALVKYLANMGVTVLLINEVEYLTSDFRITDVGISYLADNVIFLRYLEINGELHKAIGVLKKRLSDFERTLRQMEITRYGIKVGEPLTGLRGILRGTPELLGPPARLNGNGGALAASGLPLSAGQSNGMDSAAYEPNPAAV